MHESMHTFVELKRIDSPRSQRSTWQAAPVPAATTIGYNLASGLSCNKGAGVPASRTPEGEARIVEISEKARPCWRSQLMNASQAPRTQVSVLVTGGGNPWNRIAVRAARMVGLTLAEHGLGLVTGNSTGVDKAVAVAFCNELKRRKEPCKERFIQLRMRWWRRGGFWPGRAFRAPEGTNRDVGSEERLARGGAHERGGCGHPRRQGRHAANRQPLHRRRQTGAAGAVHRRHVERGVPGGASELVRQSRDRIGARVAFALAVPWVGGTGALANLLMGTLSSKAAIFLSYRRADSEWVAGRLRQDLVKALGKKRVFQDQEHIGPADMWDTSIEEALRDCRIGIVVVGPRWLERPEGTQELASRRTATSCGAKSRRSSRRRADRRARHERRARRRRRGSCPRTSRNSTAIKPLGLRPTRGGRPSTSSSETIRPLLRPEARTFP